MIDDLAGAIEIIRRIEAPPEIVFSYLTDSRRFVTWMGVGAELDARPGGRYRIDVDGEHIASAAPPGDELGLGGPSDRPARIDDGRDHPDARK